MKIKKFALCLCFFLLTVVAVAGENKIEVVCDIWPPYQTLEQDQVTGFSTKIVREVFNRMGVEIQSLEEYPWKRALYMVEKSKADALFSANYTKERTAFAYYPDEPIVQSPWVVWSREEDAFQYTGLSDLAGKKVGIVRGYSYTPEFLNILKSQCRYEEVTDDKTNFKKLNAGRVDVTIAELGNGASIVKELMLKKLIPHTNHPIKADGLYIMFNKKRISEDFVKKFSNELKKLKQESVYKIWYNEYFNLDF